MAQAVSIAYGRTSVDRKLSTELPVGQGTYYLGEIGIAVWANQVMIFSRPSRPASVAFYQLPAIIHGAKGMRSAGEEGVKDADVQQQAGEGPRRRMKYTAGMVPGRELRRETLPQRNYRTGNG
jgi:hypothetical protein